MRRSVKVRRTAPADEESPFRDRCLHNNKASDHVTQDSSVDCSSRNMIGISPVGKDVSRIAYYDVELCFYTA